MDILESIARTSETLTDMYGWHETPDADLVGSDDGHLVLIARAENRLRALARKAGHRDAAETEDRIQAAMLGYLDALTRFDPSRGTEPFTHAHTTIVKTLQDANRAAAPKPAKRDDHDRYWRAMEATDHDPVAAREWSRLQRLTGWRVQEEADAGNLVAADVIDERIARWERRGLDVAAMMHAEEGRGRGLAPHVFDGILAAVTYLDEPLTATEDTTSTAHDIVADEAPKAAYAEAENRLAARQLLDHLDERERGIVASLFGLDGKPELKAQEVAEVYGVSRSRVLNIRKAALGKLAKAAA